MGCRRGRRVYAAPVWERLLERVQAGESDGIVVWHTDRLFRQPRDLEALIALGDKGFQVASATSPRSSTRVPTTLNTSHADLN